MRPQLPYQLIDKARPGYLYYNGYSMCEVSKKKEKIKRMFEPATGCAASYGNGKRCRIFTELSRRVRRRDKAEGARNGTAVLDADF